MKKGISLLTVILVVALCLGAQAQSDATVCGAWLPYWEASAALTEADALGNRLEEAIAFACIFDSADQPLMLAEAQTLLASLRTLCDRTGAALFLSVVNDVELSPGQYENKSTALLTRLLMDDASQSSHLEALTALVDQYGLTGLELDYENLKSDAALWKQYTAFIARLWAVCERDGLRLRVVLPWDAPRYATLPPGPEYSVMCYNLYGTHSGAGPKADLDFLARTCAFYRDAGVTARMAFATGGFDWHESAITALDQSSAEAQLQNAGITAERDAASGALHATYTADGETHEVWYADAGTLATWHSVCAQNGFAAFDLFRLGGNNLSDWDQALFGTQL